MPIKELWEYELKLGVSSELEAADSRQCIEKILSPFSCDVLGEVTGVRSQKQIYKGPAETFAIVRVGGELPLLRRKVRVELPCYGILGEEEIVKAIERLERIREEQVESRVSDFLGAGGEYCGEILVQRAQVTLKPWDVEYNLCFDTCYAGRVVERQIEVEHETKEEHPAREKQILEELLRISRVLQGLRMPIEIGKGERILGITKSRMGKWQMLRR